MPFGLFNAPATQCRIKHEVLGYDLEPNLFCFLDDILLLAATVEEMLELLKEVSKRLKDVNLSINLEKSRFFASEVNYLGYVLNEEGITVDPR